MLRLNENTMRLAYRVNESTMRLAYRLNENTMRLAYREIQQWLGIVEVFLFFAYFLSTTKHLNGK